MSRGVDILEGGWIFITLLGACHFDTHMEGGFLLFQNPGGSCIIIESSAGGRQNSDLGRGRDINSESSLASR